MIGLLVLGLFAVYFAISIWVILAVLKWAVNNKRSGWWGGLAAFMMYSLVFWDWIPTLVMHKYYCSTQAGFLVYKTPEQWVKENPSLELKSSDRQTYEGTDNNHIAIKSLNQRLNNVSKFNPISVWLPIYKMETYIEDTYTKEILIQRKDYLSGYRERNGLGQLKLWMTSGSSCLDNRKDHEFYMVLEKFINIDKGNKND